MSSQGDVQTLSKLADQYRDKGKVNPREGWVDILKAHSLYNACASRSSANKWIEKAYEVQKIYWRDDVTSTLKEQREIARGFKAQLYTIRDECKDDLSPVTDLINRWDCTTDNLDSVDNKETTRQFVRGMKNLSLVANARMKIFAGKVIQQSVDLHRKSAPCKFAAVALGSMAKGEATPYSDLEFMFLIEKRSPYIIEYFESLALTVYFLINNLQETKLKYMNIEELKTFKDKGKSGFKIDGLQSKAGNIPTGNGTAQQQNKFILTVDELVDKYQTILLNPDPEESKKGDFTSMLAHTAVIYGEPSLHTDFQRRRKMLVINEERMNAHNSMIKQDIEDYDFLPLWRLTFSNHSANLKSAIYRFPSILTYNLKIIYNVESKTSWDTLDKLYQMKMLSQSFYESLQFLLASASYIRLAAYLHHNSQNDDMTFVPSLNPSSKGHYWHLHKPLHLHMSLHMIPVKQALTESNDPLHAVSTQIDYDTDVVAAHVNYYAGYYEQTLKVLETFRVESFTGLTMLADCYMSLRKWTKYQPTIRNIIRYIQARPYNPHLTGMLPFYKYQSAVGYAKAGDLAAAKKGFEEVLSELPPHLEYNFVIYADAANLYLEICEEAQSIYYYEKASANLEEMASTISQSKYDDYRSVMLQNRAAALVKRWRYREAEPLLLQNIQLLTKDYGENGVCTKSADCHLLLSNVYQVLGDHKKSLNHLRNAEARYRLINPAKKDSNPVLCERLASTYHEQGNLDRALKYYLRTLALTIKNNKHDHPVVAAVKDKIGRLLEQQGKYDEAAEYFKDALAIYETLENSFYDGGRARSHLNYGELCILLNQYSDSLHHLYQATSLRYKSHDIDHIYTVCVAWSRIGEILMSQGKYEDAALSLEKSESLHRQLKSQLPTVRQAMIYCNLGQCYMRNSITKPTTAGEKMIAHSKAHDAFVNSFSLLVSSAFHEDCSIYFFRVAAQMIYNWRLWLFVVNDCPLH